MTAPKVTSAAAAHFHHHLHGADLHAWRRLREAIDADLAHEVDQPAFAFDEEMVVVAGVGVEVGAAAVDRHFAQEAGFRELVERVVDGGERDAHARRFRLPVQLLRGNMAVALGEEDASELHALACGPEPRMAELGHYGLDL